MHASLLSLLAKGIKKSSTLLLITIVASSTILILYTVDISLGTILSLEKAIEPLYFNTTAIIIAKKSSSPFTGLVDVKPYKSLITAGLADDIVLTPVQIGNSLVVVRGVDLHLLQEKTIIKIVSGYPFDNYTLFWCTVGEGLAQLEDISPGDIVIVKTPFAKSEYPLYVAGIHSSPSMLNYEILVNKKTARILRNIPQEKASMIIIYQKAIEKIPTSEEVKQSGEEVLVISQRMKRIIEEKFWEKTVSPRTAIEYFLGKLGLSYSTLLTTSIVILAFSLISLLVTAKTFILLNIDLLKALKTSQIPERTIKELLFLLTLILISTTATATTTVFRTIYPYLLKTILFYPPLYMPSHIMIPLLVLSYEAVFATIIYREKI